MKTDIISALLFGGFVALAGWALWLGRDASQRQRGIHYFLVYTMFVSTAAGVLHREWWPFSRWQIFAYQYTPPIEALQVRAVDAQGLEYDVDRRAWEPLSSLDLHTWIQRHLLALTPAQQAIVGHYLLHLVNSARERAAQGMRVGIFERYWGPLRAPLHVIHTPIWSDPGAVPSTPFTGLRIYRDRWDVRERADDPRRVDRTLFYAYTLP